jgi:hypothetical protein
MKASDYYGSFQEPNQTGECGAAVWLRSPSSVSLKPAYSAPCPAMGFTADGETNRGPSKPTHAACRRTQPAALRGYDAAGTQTPAGPKSAAVLTVQVPKPSSLLNFMETGDAACSAPLPSRLPTPPPLTPQQHVRAAPPPFSPSEASCRAAPAGNGLECWLAAWGALAKDKAYFAWARGGALAGSIQVARATHHPRKRGPTG